LSFSLFLDENVDVELAVLLARGGYDVLTTQGAGRTSQGISDEEQLEFASSSGRAVFTHDVQDFEVLARGRVAQGKRHTGIIVGDVRPAGELYGGLPRLFKWYPDGVTDYILRLPREP
jgi:predicted nuclease of predicted toxin-antitoxin system